MPSYAVIGGSRGIGLELVRQLSANAENTVIVTVRNKAKSTHLNEHLRQSQKKNVHVIESDVVDQSAMEAAAAEAAKVTNGALDVLVYNAARMEAQNRFNGILDYESPEALDAEFIAAFKVNVLGTIHSVNAFLPLLRKGSLKKIIVVGTEGGDITVTWKTRLSQSAAYGVTKAAEHMVATKYAAELEDEGFVVVSVSPGLVDVSGTATETLVNEHTMPVIQKVMKNLFAAYPKATTITPEESARRLVSFIASIGPAENGMFHPCAECTE